MPISEKIIDEINKLNVENDMKKLMEEILQLEDDGVKRWNKEYQAKITDYIKWKEQEG